MTPGEGENAREELKLADQALRAGNLLLAEGVLEDATSRIYYSVFHAAGAALMVNGLYAKSHTGQITLFERTFGRTPLLNQLFGWRLDADYSRDRKFTLGPDHVARAADGAAAFIERCREIVSESLARGADEPDPPADL